MNGQAISRWMKANLVIVVCILVIIGAPVGLWFVSTGWSEELQDDIKARGSKLDQLGSAGRSQFAWPGSSKSTQVVVTPELVSAFKAHADLLRQQADDVVTEANQRNHAGFENHFTSLLPFPTPKQVVDWNDMSMAERAAAWAGVSQGDRDEALYQALQVQPQLIHAELLKLYESLLEDELNAGLPPDPEDVSIRLESVRDALTDGGANMQSLDEQEREDLDRKLGDERLAIYRERAEGIGIYLSLETLAPPSFAATDVPDQGEITHWLWRYWVMQRLAQGIKAANGDNTSEINAAIKRIDRIDVRGLMELETPAAGDRSFSGASGHGGRGGGSGGSGGSGGQGPPRGGPGGPPGAPPMPPGGPPRGPGGGGPGLPPGGGGIGPGAGAPTGPAAPAPGQIDRTKSISGRISNQLYDVVLVDLDMIVATDRIDEVLRAFSRPVETAVLDVVISRGDAFAALQQGYYYGTGSVSRLVLTVETIWLRQWTQVHLPDSVRLELGFPPRQAPAAAGQGGPGAQPGRPGGFPRPPGPPG